MGARDRPRLWIGVRPSRLARGLSSANHLEAREALRRTLIADLSYRGEVSSLLLREGGTGMADLIDLLTLNPDAGRQVVRLLGELEASD